MRALPTLGVYDLVFPSSYALYTHCLRHIRRIKYAALCASNHLDYQGRYPMPPGLALFRISFRHFLSHSKVIIESKCLKESAPYFAWGFRDVLTIYSGTRSTTTSTNLSHSFGVYFASRLSNTVLRFLDRNKTGCVTIRCNEA